MPTKKLRRSETPKGAKTGQAEPGRRGRSVSPEDRIAIVRYRFEGYRRRGQATPLTVIEEKFGHPPSVISRIIASAFKEGLVDVVGKDPSTQPAREESWQEKLTDKFRQLRKAIVIRLPENLALEKRHQALGAAASAYLANERLHDGARIGVGCGGAVYHTISKLRDWAPLPFEDITVFSLTGSMYSNLPDRIWHDADFNAGMFAACFGPTQNVKLRVTGSRLVAQEPVPKESYFSLDNFANEHPELAILGVGPGHRFWDEAIGKGEPLLQPIHQDLATLWDLCKPRIPADGDYSLSPLGSLCNHLFLIRPPREKPLPKEDEIRRLIEKINKNLLNMDDAHLKLIPNLLVVAGGSQKAFAIREVLRQPDMFKIRALITDVQAAELILS